MSSVKRSLISGVYYTALSKYFGVFLQLVIGAVLARILSPEEFGVLSIATVFLSFFILISDFGFGSAIIQERGLAEEDINQIYSATIYCALISAVAFYFGAGLISWYYNDLTLLAICRWLSVGLLLNISLTVPSAVLRMRKRFKYMAISSIIAQVLGGGISILSILLGAGILGVVFGGIISSATMLILYVMSTRPKFRYKFSFVPIGKILRFSAYQFLFNFINYFSRNLDTLLIGKFLGPRSLGFYDKSYRLMLVPLQNVTHVITPVLHPILSDIQHDKVRMFEGYLKVVNVLAIVGFSASVLLHFSAKELILIVYGSQWLNSVHVFQILALSIGFQVVLSSCGAVFQAANDAKGLFINGAISFVAMGAAIGFGVFYYKTIEMVAALLVGAFVLNFFINFTYLIKVSLGASVIRFWRSLIPALMIALVMYLSLKLMGNAVSVYSLPVSLLSKSMIALAVFGAMLILTKQFEVIKQNWRS